VALPDLTNEHHTDNLVVCCSDFRLEAHLEAWIAKHVGTADRLVVVGGGLAFLRQGCHADAAWDDLETLQGLHGFTDIWIVNHTGCGAYKAFRNGNDPETQLAAHAADLTELRRQLEARGLKAHLRVMQPSGDFVTIDGVTGRD
jgi:carbonic anhydrase